MTGPTGAGRSSGPQVEKPAERYYREAGIAARRFRRVMRLLANPPEIAVGASPRETVWRRNKARLYHYLPPAHAARPYPVPLLLVYALINKPYVFDLRPGASLVEFLTGRGYQVYLLDWGAPGPEDAGLRIDDYVLEYLPIAVKHTLRHSGAQEVSLLGYCLGGVLTACFVALHPELPVRNLILVAAPLDFSQGGLLKTWLDSKYFDVDLLVAAYGNVPGELIDFGSKLLKPYPNFIGNYLGAFDKLADPQAAEAWLSMNRWVNDGVPLAGAAFKQLVEDFYRGNKLTRGELKLGGRTVRLADIRANLLNVIAEHDHIALPSQSRPVMDLAGSPDKEQLILPAGHVGLMAGRSASQGLWPALDRWLAARSR